MPDHAAAHREKIKEAEDAEHDDQLTILRKYVIGFVQMVPEVGGPLGLVLDLMWPDKKKESVFDSVKEQTKELVDVSILEAKTETLKDKIRAWKGTLRKYHDVRLRFDVEYLKAYFKLPITGPKQALGEPRLTQRGRSSTFKQSQSCVTALIGVL